MKPRSWFQTRACTKGDRIIFNLFVETGEEKVAIKVRQALYGNPSAIRGFDKLFSCGFEDLSEASRHERAVMMQEPTKMNRAYVGSVGFDTDEEDPQWQAPMDVWLGAYYAGEMPWVRIVWAHEIEDILKGKS